MPRRPHTARLVRLPPEIDAAVVALAQRADRTVTAQILRMLREWLEAHPEEHPVQEREGQGSG